MMNGQWFMIYQTHENIKYHWNGKGNLVMEDTDRLIIDWVPVKWVLLELGRMLNDI